MSKKILKFEHSSISTENNKFIVRYTLKVDVNNVIEDYILLAELLIHADKLKIAPLIKRVFSSNGTLTSTQIIELLELNDKL